MLLTKLLCNDRNVFNVSENYDNFCFYSFMLWIILCNLQHSGADVIVFKDWRE